MTGIMFIMVGRVHYIVKFFRAFSKPGHRGSRGGGERNGVGVAMPGGELLHTKARVGVAGVQGWPASRHHILGILSSLFASDL